MSGLFHTRLAEASRATEAALDGFLSRSDRPGEVERPEQLLAAMRYAVLAPGKRLGPLVLIEAAQLFGAEGEAVIGAAAALECVHAGALTHAELPAIDDNDLRRGQPTLHRAFGEAAAILAGDALLALALDIVADRTDLVRLLARGAGAGGLAGGQMLDLALQRGEPDIEAALRVQAIKTGALFQLAGESGATVAGASPEDCARLAAYGAGLGFTVRIADDLIEATAPAREAAKPLSAREAARRKASVVALHGLAGTRALLATAVDEAIGHLAPYGSRAAILVEAVHFAADRKR